MLVEDKTIRRLWQCSRREAMVTWSRMVALRMEGSRKTQNVFCRVTDLLHCVPERCQV